MIALTDVDRRARTQVRAAFRAARRRSPTAQRITYRVIYRGLYSSRVARCCCSSHAAAGDRAARARVRIISASHSPYPIGRHYRVRIRVIESAERANLDMDGGKSGSTLKNTPFFPRFLYAVRYLLVAALLRVTRDISMVIAHRHRLFWHIPYLSRISACLRVDAPRMQHGW